MLKSVAGDLVTGALSKEPEVRKGSGGQDRAEELKKACQEFEAILNNQLLKVMRQSSLKAEESDQARDIFEGMMDQTLSVEVSRQNRFGLGQMLYERLLPLVASGSAKSRNAEASAAGAETQGAQLQQGGAVALKDDG